MSNRHIGLEHAANNAAPNGGLKSLKFSDELGFDRCRQTCFDLEDLSITIYEYTGMNYLLPLVGWHDVLYFLMFALLHCNRYAGRVYEIQFTICCIHPFSATGWRHNTK